MKWTVHNLLCSLKCAQRIDGPLCTYQNRKEWGKVISLFIAECQKIKKKFNLKNVEKKKNDRKLS